MHFCENVFETNQIFLNILYKLLLTEMFFEFISIVNCNHFRRDGKCPLTQQDSDLVIGASVVNDRKRPGKTMKNDHLTSFQTVNGTNSLSG